MHNLNSRLNTLSKETEDFYQQTFTDDEAEYQRNQDIKSAIVMLIIEASQHNANAIMEQALQLLFDNTGCHEDYAILQQLLPMLSQQAGISSETLQYYLSETPLSRWL